VLKAVRASVLDLWRTTRHRREARKIDEPCKDFARLPAASRHSVVKYAVGNDKRSRHAHGILARGKLLLAKAITTMTRSGATDEFIVKMLRYGADDLERRRQSRSPKSA